MVLLGVLTQLKFPYPRCVDEPDTYDQIRVHAEWGKEFKPEESNPTFAVRSIMIDTPLFVSFDNHLYILNSTLVESIRSP